MKKLTICGVEQQLQQTGEDNGDGVKNNVPKQRTPEHTLVGFCHKKHLLKEIVKSEFIIVPIL